MMDRQLGEKSVPPVADWPGFIPQIAQGRRQLVVLGYQLQELVVLVLAKLQYPHCRTDPLAKVGGRSFGLDGLSGRIQFVHDDATEHLDDGFRAVNARVVLLLQGTL